MQRDHAGTLGDPSAPGFQAAPARVSLRSARAAYVGPGLDLEPHRNAVAVVAFGLDAPFDLAMLETGATVPAYVSRRAALIPPGQLHHLRAHGPMAFLYLDALSDDHAALSVADLHRLQGGLLDVTAGAMDVDDLCERIGLARRAFTDPRIVALLRAIDDAPEAFPSLAIAANVAGLSPSRCRALMREAVGMPFSRYRLWRRMARVCQEFAAEPSLTNAAHAAGFASSAHLSTAFKQMFGLSPSTLIKAGVQFDCDSCATAA
ncbi:MAG: helix-turn-helix transcriptional regulator [Pseudomonadota bacterium]